MDPRLRAERAELHIVRVEVGPGVGEDPSGMLDEIDAVLAESEQSTIAAKKALGAAATDGAGGESPESRNK